MWVACQVFRFIPPSEADDGYICVQLTGKANKEGPPPIKRSRVADGSSRRVTFNPNVQERAVPPAVEPPKPVTLKEVADVVVRCLDPFYTQGKFATKVSDAIVILCGC